MDFKTAALLGNYISKDYAGDMFGLLLSYKDISASEAASRLGLHIKTAQEFLDAFENLGILEKVEVYEGKRPYYRYSLKERRIKMEIDLDELRETEPEGSERMLVRERKNAGARFTTSRDHLSISSVTIWKGAGRDRKERKINLTRAQGRFLFHLPFPNAKALAIGEIMKKAGVEESYSPEIVDIVKALIDEGVIETL